MAEETEVKAAQEAPQEVKMPSPTAWPIVLAFGITLMAAGLATSIWITALGAVFAIFGAVGWFRNLFPHEQHYAAPLEVRPMELVTIRPKVRRIELIPERHRARLPVEIYPISAGVRGGLAGAAAMAGLAMLYGYVSHHSVWYPINLLAAIVYKEPLLVSSHALTSFNIDLFLVASAIHVIVSVLVGLVYGAVLPMFPRRPILLGGLIAPIGWCGLVYSALDIVNPLLNQRISWPWFAASQVGFGIVAGLVVTHQARVRTRQYLPFAARAGLEVAGGPEQKGSEGGGNQ